MAINRTGILAFRRALFQRAIEGKPLRAGRKYVYTDGYIITERKATRSDVATVMAELNKRKSNPMPSLRRTESLTAARLTHLLKQLPAKAKLIIHKSGLVQAQVPKRASNPRRGRRKNIAAGFYDEEGIFHPIRASYDYSGGRVGERKKRKKAKRRKSKR